MKKHTPFIVLLGCILLQGGTIGIMANCMSVFFAPIANEFGFSNFEMSLMTTIRTLAISLAMINGPKLYQKLGFNSLLSIGAAMAGIAYASMAFLKSALAFDICCAIIGIGFGLLITIPATIMINNWFNKSVGFYLGLSLAASGIFGSIFSPISSSLATAYGWRVAVMAFALFGTVMTLPATLFLCKMAPADNEDRYGEAAEASKEVPVGKNTGGLGILLLTIIIMLVGNCITQLTYQFSLFTKQMGMALSVAGGLNLACMLGNTGGKVILGFLNDKIGPWKTLLLSFGLIGVALVVFVLGNETLMYIAAGIIGASFGVVVHIPSMVARALYAEKVGWFTSLSSGIATFGSAIFASFIGYLSDALNGYTLIYLTFGLLCLLSIAIILKIAAEARS